MSNRKMILLFLILTLLLSGCWSKRELHELAIVVALGIDKVDEDFEVSIQVVDPSSRSESNFFKATIQWTRTRCYLPC